MSVSSAIGQKHNLFINFESPIKETILLGRFLYTENPTLRGFHLTNSTEHNTDVVSDVFVFSGQFHSRNICTAK